MEVVYSISQGDIIWRGLFGSLFLLVMTLLTTALDTSKSREFRRLFRAAGVVASVTLLGALVFKNIVPTRALTAALEEGRAQVVEGPVESLERLSKNGERFTVDGVRFEYADYTIEPGFKDVRGPIRPNRWVRVQYVPYKGRNVIVRLEVR